MTKIVVLDYGDAQIEGLISHIEAQGAEVQRADRAMRAADIQTDPSIRGVMLAGGPFTVYADDIHVVDPKIFELDIPLLGIGRGMQVMLNELGGTVTPAGYQYTPTDSALTIHNTQSGIFQGLPPNITKPLGFDAKVSALPHGFSILASGKEVESGDNRPFGATECPEKQLYGIQFVVDTKNCDVSAGAVNNFVKMCR